MTQFKRGDRVAWTIQLPGTNEMLTLPAVVRNGNISGLVEIKSLAPIHASNEHASWPLIGVELVKLLKTKPERRSRPNSKGFKIWKTRTLNPGDYGCPLAHMRVRPESLRVREDGGPEFVFAGGIGSILSQKKPA